MSRILITIGLSLIASLLLGFGLLAVIDPVKLVRVLNYLYGQQPRDDAWWAVMRWYDPAEVERSRDMRTQYRMMGIGFLVVAVIFFWSLFGPRK